MIYDRWSERELKNTLRLMIRYKWKRVISLQGELGNLLEDLHTSPQIAGSARGETGVATDPSEAVNARESTSSTTSPASCTITLLKSIPGGMTCIYTTHQSRS